MRAANPFLDIGILKEQLKKIAQSDRCRLDAKNTKERFSVGKRCLLNQSLESFYGADLANGYYWMMQNNPSASLFPKLTSAIGI